jgi:general secretion pathway protein F
MPAFKYEALDASGKKITGLIEADQPKAARTQLRSQGLVPMSMSQVAAEEQAQTAASSLRVWGRGKIFSATGLAVWTRQLAGLITSGLPLERALTALSEESDHPRQRELVAHLRSEVNAGSTFAKALGTMPREFDEVYRGVIAAGEQSGALGQVLERLSDDLEERQELKSKLIAAALYPAIVSLVAVVIVIFLVTYVVPQVASVFANSKRSLPTLTIAMLGISSFLRSYGWILLLALAGTAMMFSWSLRNESTRVRFDAALLRLPLVGRLSRGYNAARFASTLALLAGAGVPILKALQAAAETVSNRAMREDALDALVMVREGAPLASALAGKKRFPGLLAMFAKLGEQTGRLPDMLERASKQLGAEVQRRAMQFATLLEPLLVVTMGVVVMLIVLAVLLPIIQLNTWVK